MKKILAIMVALSLVFSLALPALAAEPAPEENTAEITPYSLILGDYNLIRAVKSGNTISAAAYTQGRANATSSYVRIDLYRKAGGASTYTLWKSGTTMKNASGGYVGANESWSTISGYTYKVVSTHTAYGGSTKETKTLSRVV